MTDREELVHIAETIRGKAAAYRDDTAEALARMVRIPSLSGEEEQVIREINALAGEFGIADTRVDGLGNLIARVGSGPRILAIDAHVDTVDTGDRDMWDFDPFSGLIRDGYVHGRGSVDQEGGAASMLTAARILKEIGYDGGFTVFFTFTVMEEDCDGMCWNYMIQEDGLVPEFAVITEPTNLGVYRGHRGRMEMSVRFRGRSAHGSAPHRGVSAVYQCSRASLEVESLNSSLKPDPFLGSGSAVVSRVSSSAPSLCAVPDGAEMYVDRRLTWGETRETAVREVEEIAREAWRATLAASGGAESAGEPAVTVPIYRRPSYTGLTFSQDAYFPTWMLPEEHPLVRHGARAAALASGSTPAIGKWTFSTNGVAICGTHQIPTIGFGPGDEIHAHAPNERTPIDHLEKAAAVYAILPLVMEEK